MVLHKSKALFFKTHKIPLDQDLDLGVHLQPAPEFTATSVQWGEKSAAGQQKHIFQGMLRDLLRESYPC